jgi:nonsense-mediated mRNA decay protein 3
MAVTVAEVSSTIFWRYPFDSICDPKQLTEYIVMDIDLILDKDRKTFPGQGAVSSKVFFIYAQANMKKFMFTWSLLK